MNSEKIYNETLEKGIADLIRVNMNRKAGEYVLYDHGEGESPAVIISSNENRLLMYVQVSEDEFEICSVEVGNINTIKMTKHEMRMFLAYAY